MNTARSDVTSPTQNCLCGNCCPYLLAIPKLSDELVAPPCAFLGITLPRSKEQQNRHIRLSTAYPQVPQKGSRFILQKVPKILVSPFQCDVCVSDYQTSSIAPMSVEGRVSRAPRKLSAARNCTRDEGGPFEFGDQEPISSHRKPLRPEAVVVSVAETPGQDFGRHGRERRAQANRCRSVESGLGDVRTGG